MKPRKHMKKAARKSLKKHYLIFVVVCLLAAYMGSEFTNSLNMLNITPSEEQEAVPPSDKTQGEVSGGVVVKQSGLLDVLMDALAGDENKDTSAEKNKIQKPDNKNAILGRSRGVFAMAVNAVTSGSIYVTLITAVSSMIGSRDLAVLLLIAISMLLMFAFWFFIKNIVKVVSRRIFLEGRTYEAVPIKRFLFLLRVKKWKKAACTMFLVYLYQMLWDLTIIGGIIKHFSYFMVPYIVAENPDMRARDAIKLSRNMMKGHKWECFVLSLSFIGWNILGVLTLGLLDIFYTNPYRICTYCEYYEHIRELAREQKIENAGLLNDRYLFEKPEPEVIAAVYLDVNTVLSKPPKELKELKGFPKFIAEWFGVILLNTKAEQEYEKSQAERIRIHELKQETEGKAYPGRLYPVPEAEKRRRVESLYYMRHYTIWSLILLFFSFAFIGWVWEVSLHLVSDGVFVNRGVLHGPWLPIYGAGGVLILVFLNKLRAHPVLEFVGTVVLCGIVEYGTSYYLQVTHDGKKWWDYTGYFLNINGRVCAEGLLVFGIGGMAIVYLLAPLLDNHIKKIKTGILIPVCVVLVMTFLADQVYSGKHPNVGKGITDYQSRAAVSRTVIL